MRLLLFLLIFLPIFCLTGKILVYNPKWAFSHMNFMGAVADTLQKAGHNVTVLQPVLRKEYPGTGSKHAYVLTLETNSTPVEKGKDKELKSRMWSTSNFNPIGVVFAIPTMRGFFNTMLDAVLQNPAVVSQLKDGNYDAIVHELFDYSGFVIQHVLDIKTGLGVHTTAIFDDTASILGLPRAPGDVPDLFGIAPVDGSFVSRLMKYFYSFFSSHFETGLLGISQDYMNLRFKNPPSIREMIANLSFIFANSDPFFDFPRPTLHKIVDIGGLGVRKPKALDNEWKKVLIIKTTNVLISFGSVASSTVMPEESKKSLVNVIKRFSDVNFIWKYEEPEDGTGKGLENLHLSSWTPQTDLLASGKITLFITHGGAGSVMEAATHGVPTLVVPIFGDQMRNARMIQNFGCGKIFNKAGLSDESLLVKALEDALSDEKLKNRAQTAKKMIENRHFPPDELLARHVDLALKFPDLKHFTPEARNFSVIQYYNLDVYLVFFVLFYIFCYLFIILFQKCTSRFTKAKTE